MKRKVSLSFTLVALLATGGCATMSDTPATGQGAALPPADARGIDDYVLVDCLLPGQIRQLGTSMTYLSPRRSVKSTKSDCAIRGGEFVLFDRSDYGSALQVLRPKAQAGDPVAQTYLGEIYEKGLGLPAPDHAAAVSWYRQAAEQGYAPAQTALGSLYERGLGVPADKTKALDLYRRAAGLSADRLVFESTLKSQQEAFRREIAVRNRVAAALRARLQQASAKPATGAKTTATAAVDQQALRRQAESQRRDAESEAERVKKELNGIRQLEQSSAGAGKSADPGKSAQLGKLALVRKEEFQALVDTSRQLSQVLR